HRTGRFHRLQFGSGRARADRRSGLCRERQRGYPGRAGSRGCFRTGAAGEQGRHGRAIAGEAGRSRGQEVTASQAIRGDKGSFHDQDALKAFLTSTVRPQFLHSGRRPSRGEGEGSQMCGIVGIVGNAPVAPLIVDALKRVEYRGYDSAGVATVENGALARRRAEGKLINLENRLRDQPLGGTIGIGHTRWATHGVPNETNAHPHFSRDVAIVHNGIIENFAELRDELVAAGFEFSSQTDTEVIAHLVTHGLDSGLAPFEAAHAAIKRLHGAFALAIMFRGDDNLLIGARNGPPLAVGHGEGEMYLGSDAIALAPFTDSITYLEDGDWVVVRRNEMQIFD